MKTEDPESRCQCKLKTYKLRFKSVKLLNDHRRYFLKEIMSRSHAIFVCNYGGEKSLENNIENKCSETDFTPFD